MAYRSMMALVLGVALVPLGAGCAGDGAYDPSFSPEGTAEGTSTSGGGAQDVGGDAPTTTSTTSTTSTTWDSSGSGDGSTGGVEDTLFGMSDDMPLVSNIPDIKQGFVIPGMLVSIEQVLPTTTRASLGRDAWIYVQDPYAEEHMGLRVVLHRGDEAPPEGHAVYLEGFVQHDAQGWLLELEDSLTGGEEPSPQARRVRVATLTAPNAAALDDSVVDVVEPSALVVTRRGPVAGTLLVGAVASSSGALLVDLRPFGLDDAVPSPGTHLSRLRGVVEIGGPRPVILPRSVDDLVVAR
jgi:hypothetical protein